MLKAENIKWNKTYIWDTLEIDWKEVTVTFNENEVNLPRVAAIKLQDKIRVRCLMNRQSLLFHLMLKQRITWYTLAADTQEIVQITLQINITKCLKFQNDNKANFPDGMYIASRMQFPLQILQV